MDRQGQDEKTDRRIAGHQRRRSSQTRQWASALRNAMKFNLDIRKSKAWQQLRQEGVEASKAEYTHNLIEKWTARGKTKKQIAELLDISVAEVRKLVNGHPR